MCCLCVCLVAPPLLGIAWPRGCHHVKYDSQWGSPLILTTAVNKHVPSMRLPQQGSSISVAYSYGVVLCPEPRSSVIKCRLFTRPLYVETITSPTRCFASIWLNPTRVACLRDTGYLSGPHYGPLFHLSTQSGSLRAIQKIRVYPRGANPTATPVRRGLTNPCYIMRSHPQCDS